MSEIKVSPRNGEVVFSLTNDRGQSAEFPVSVTDAEVLALQLLTLVSEVRGPGTGSLWEQTPMATAHNPRVEYTKRDDGKVLVAVGIDRWRPIYLILDDARLIEVNLSP